MSSEPDVARLGHYIATRRGDVPQERIVELGGPSTTVQSELETGKYARQIRSATYRKIDAGLRWKPGSAERVAHGGEPEPEAAKWPPLHVEKIAPVRVAIDNLTDDELLAELRRRLKREDGGTGADSTAAMYRAGESPATDDVEVATSADELLVDGEPSQAPARAPRRSG